MHLSYQYHLHTWGGFYNEQYQAVHKRSPGEFLFDTESDRQVYVDELQRLEVELNARVLMTDLSEGYCCGIRTVLHRVIEWEGKRYYSEKDLGVNYPFSAARYHMAWKWYLGHNDYPLGEDFDYETYPPKIIQEWITGADQEEYES